MSVTVTRVILAGVIALSPSATQSLETLKRLLPKDATAQFSLEAGETVMVKELGKLPTPSGQVRVFYYELIWGASNRSTKRLFFFTASGEYLGQISHFPDPPDRIDGDTLLFHPEPGRPADTLRLTAPQLPANIVLGATHDSFKPYR